MIVSFRLNTLQSRLVPAWPSWRISEAYEFFAEGRSVLKHLALLEDKNLVLLSCMVLVFYSSAKPAKVLLQPRLFSETALEEK